MQKQKQTKALAMKPSLASLTLKDAHRQAASSRREPAHVPEVLPAGSPAAVAAASRERSDGILVQVRQDIDNAELGRFFALRAGVGLIVVKELCAHGEFMPEALRMIPGRHPRTLQRYINEARLFLDAKALMAHDVWLPLSQVGQRSGRLLGPGGGEDLPQPAADAAEWLAKKDEEKKPKKPEPGPEKKLSAAERRQAAIDRWRPLAGQVKDWGVDRPNWQYLALDELESVVSVLRTVADAMMAFARKAAR